MRPTCWARKKVCRCLSRWRSAERFCRFLRRNRTQSVAAGLAVLSLLATMLGGMMGSVVLAVIVIVLVNALNLALGIIDPTIQGLRLHYVEFFSKFYLGRERRSAALMQPATTPGGVLP